MLRELTTRRRRVRGEPGRRHRGRRGRDVHLARRRGPRGARRRRRAVLDGVRRDRRRQLGGRHDPVAGPARRRSSRRSTRSPAADVEARLARGAGAAARAACRRGRSRPATTRRSRPGTAWRSARSPMRRGCSAHAPDGAADAARYRAAAERAADVILGGPARRGRPARPIVEGRPRDGPGRPRGLRGPRRRPARAVRGDVRRALVHDGPRRSPTRSSSGSPIRPAASSTPRRTTSASSPGRRTSRTTPRRRAARWRRSSCSGSPR